MAIRKADKVYLECLLELNSGFGEQLLAIQDGDYPGSCAVALIKSLDQASRVLAGRIRDLIRESQRASADAEDILAEASNIYDFIDYFQSFVFPVLRSSDIRSVPAELVRPLERLSALLFPDSKLIISSVPVTNYYFSEISPKIKEMFENLDIGGILAEQGIGSSEIFHLQLSANPPCGILSHCLLGHEIGHALYKKAGLENRIPPLLVFEEAAITRCVDSHLQSMAANLNASGPTQMALQQTREFVEYVTRVQLPIMGSSWAEEMFSDIVGTGLFGPAYVCSLALLLLPYEDMDSPSDGYPPSRLRVQACINALDRTDPGFGYRKLKVGSESRKDYDSLVKPWREVVGSQYKWPDQEPYRTVFESVLGIKANIINEAKAALSKSRYSPVDFGTEVPTLRARIADWLPPNEYQQGVGAEEPGKRLTITPLLEIGRQVQKGSCSIDVRLGTHFLLQRRANIGLIEPGKAKSPADDFSVTRYVVPFGNKIVLHPKQFVLGSTLEYVRMPLDLGAYVVGRSSWGRVGLVVATAIGIHPGFRGVITFELSNLCEVPITLRPGRTIAQVFFHNIEGYVDPCGVQTHSIGDSIPQAIYDFPDAELAKIIHMAKS
ncbi:MAG: dCTP deaminase [Chloroflexi bacterium]|nr:dCTP deaminase [Chloroflexota bacterium]